MTTGLEHVHTTWTKSEKFLDYLDIPSRDAGNGRPAMKQSKKRSRDAEGHLRPTMDSLRAFVELGERIKAAREQGTKFASLSKAAEALDDSYSKSNVFRALSELERNVYRRQLVNRNKITLTSEGETVFAWARELLQLHQRGRKWPLGEREEIRIGTSNWILNFVLPEIIRVFLEDRAKRKRKDPSLTDLDLVFGEYDVERLLQDLREGTVHAGIAAVFAAGSWPDLDAVTLRPQVATVMIASSQHERWGKEIRRHKHQVELKEVAGETVCVLEADLFTVLPGLPEPRPGGSRILVKNYASVVALVRAGGVVGFIPQLDMRNNPNPAAYEGLEVYHIADEVPIRMLATLRRSGEELPAEVAAFLRIAEEKLR